MRLKKWTVAFVCLGIMMLSSAQGFTQDKTKEPPQASAEQGPSPEQMKEMMQKWMASMTPGEHHKRLDVLVGKWETTTKTWMAGPTAPPMESKGSSQSEWVLDGRFVKNQYKGEFVFPDETGAMKKMPFEGIGFTGYDNNRNMYVSTWLDNMATYITLMQGSVDPSGKIFTFYGEMDEPTLNVYGRMVKFVTQIVDENTHIFTIYDLLVGDQYKVMEITYNRKK